MPPGPIAKATRMARDRLGATLQGAMRAHAAGPMPGPSISGHAMRSIGLGHAPGQRARMRKALI